MSSKTKLVAKETMVCLNDEDSFEFVEAFKTLRTNLTFSLAQREHKRILLTSSLPSEGKTTTAVSLAIAISQTGSKVLLVDADMRNPKIHRYVKQKNDIGLSAVLSGIAPLKKAIATTDFENLYVIKAGQIPPNPAELLEGKFIATAFNEMEEFAEYIIIDTPPLNLVSDSLSIARQDTAILFVLREAVSTHEEFKKSLRSIELSNSDLIGVVLNDSQTDKRSAYYKKGKYGYKYGYGYGYGYGHTPGKKSGKDDEVN